MPPSAEFGKFMFFFFLPVAILVGCGILVSIMDAAAGSEKDDERPND